MRGNLSYKNRRIGSRNLSGAEGCEIVLGCGVIFIAFYALYVFVLQWAWNAFMVPVFHLTDINFIQAFALSILLAALTKVVSRS